MNEPKKIGEIGDEKFELELFAEDLDLGEIRILTEEHALALPEAGASLSWNSCTNPALN